MRENINKEILIRLFDMITENKKELIEQNAVQRTRHITVVLENIYQSHNASAVVRSCDCFGIQDVHVISSKNEYVVNREVAMGSGKWVDTHNHIGQNTYKCLTELKAAGYKIVATTPHINDQQINELDISKPIALVFGTEKSGLSEDAIAMADEFVKIPMYGFAESFNISVSAALCLQVLREKLMKSEIDWQLDEDALVQLQIDWCKTVIPRGEKVYQTILKELENK